MLVSVIFLLLISSTISSAAHAETITNSATANFTINGASYQLSDSVQFTKDTVVTPPDEIAFSKQSNKSNALVGDIISFTLSANNTNNNDINNVVISDFLPAGLSYIAGSAKLNNSAINSNQINYAGNQLTLNLGAMPANSLWTVSYDVNADSEGVLANTATITGDNLTPASSIATVTVSTPVIDPIKPIRLAKSAEKDTIKLGESVIYHLTITNPNNQIIPNVVLNDVLPQGMTFVNYSALLNGNAITADTSNGLAFNLGDMPAQTVWYVQYQTKLSDTHNKTSFTNEASIVTDEASANSNVAKATVALSDFQLDLSKMADKTKVYFGDTVLYTIRISNPENTNLSNITITDDLPSGFVYSANSAKINGVSVSSPAFQVTGRSLQFIINSLLSGATQTITYEVKVSRQAPLGNAINSAQATADLVSSNTAIANVNVIGPVLPLELIKQANKTHVKVGDIITYSLSIKNPNQTILKNTVLEDQLPNGLVYIPGSARLNNNPVGADVSEGLSFTIGDIAANANWSLTYQAKLEERKSNVLINTAILSTDKAQANSRVASAVVEILNDSIEIEKNANKKRAYAGDIVLYTISVTNPENHAQENVLINDTFPEGFIYQQGSANIKGETLSDAQIKLVNNKLSFSIGTLKKGQTLSIDYQLKVSNSTKPGAAINTAQAKSDFAKSPIVNSTVKIRTPSSIEFLKINSNGKESVIPPTSYNANKEGGKSWQEINEIILPDGTATKLPDTQTIKQANEYSLLDPIIIEVTDRDQNLDPNTLDTIIITIEVPGTHDKEVLLLTETSANSGVFRGVILPTTEPANVQNGRLSLATGSKITVTYRDDEDKTDISAKAALIVPESQLLLTKSANKQKASIGEQVKYTLSFKNTTAYNIPNLTLVDKLPPGFRLIAKTIRLNGEALEQPLQHYSYNGRIITFELGKMLPGEQWELEYISRISAGVQTGTAINTAQINSSKFKSNLAYARVNIKDDLMRSHNILTGRVYIGCKTGKDARVLKNARIFMETGRSILSDRDGFWHMEGITPGSHVLQLDEESLSPEYEPLLCEENTRFAGDAKSRFVDLQAGTLWRVDFYVKELAKKPSQSDKDKQGKINATDPLKIFDKSYLESAKEGFEILWPRNNYVPAIASTKIFVKSSPNQRVEVYLNGQKVSPLNYDGSSTNKKRTVTIRRWKGVDIDINRKNNTLLVILKSKSGKEIARKTHNIHFSGEPDSVEFLAEQSTLIADGKTAPVIAIRVKDQDGYPMRANTHGYYTLVDSRYKVKTQDNEDNLDLNENISGTYKYQIEEGGIAYIKLNPTTQSGEIKLKIKLRNNKEKVITSWLKPKLRNWIMVGIAEGTLAHKTLSGNMQALKDLDKADKTYKRGRIAFFAKGRVKGKYLLTIAYDTHKKKRDGETALERPINNIDPDAWYTIYADNSNSQYNAPSSRKLYLKIEKDNFYALFGDYQTGLSVTDLTKYERVLTGIKSEYNGKKVKYTAFISETSNKHHHEEIPGDGTSGLYYLSHDIVVNSERITIETRDRFHSDRILESKTLSRYQDYTIDYDAGSLFFKFPINGRDQNFNPIFIVIDYDSETDNTKKDLLAGGRVAVKSKDDKLEVGLSTIVVDKANSKNDSLLGLDVRYKLTPNTEIHAEIAQSKSSSSDYKKTSAEIIELEKQIENMEARLYYRKQDKGFGLGSEGSTSSIESDTRKIGAEIRYKFDNNTELNAELSQQNNLSNNNQRKLANLAIIKHYKQFTLNSGIRHTREKLDDKTIRTNSLILGGKYTRKDGKVSLRANIEKSYNGKNGSEISPDRATVGVDVRLNKDVSLFAEHEITDNGETKTQTSRVGLSKSLWKGAKAKTSYSQERNDQGQRNYATLGLSQRIKVTDKIRADFTIDRAKTIGGSQTQFNTKEPLIDGPLRDDYTAFTVGLGSNDKDLSWTSRIEYRNGDLQDKINFTASLIRRLNNGKQISGKLSYYNADKITGEDKTLTKLSLGTAWHPKEEDFVFFSRLDLVDEDSNSQLDNTKTRTQKIVHNMHYNRKINKKTQISLHHGIKRIFDKNESTHNDATIDTGTIEIRRDINKKVDIGLRGGYLHDWTEKTVEALAGVSIGMTPVKNAWIELGYNFEGFDDEDFDQNNYKRKGPYASFRYKFNQDSFKNELPIRRKPAEQTSKNTARNKVDQSSGEVQK